MCHASLAFALKESDVEINPEDELSNIVLFPVKEDDCCDPAIDTICDYALLPNIDTPATDAFLSEVRAQGVDAAIEAAKNLVAQEYEYKDFKAGISVSSTR
jgi:hypothetical protein